MALALVTKTRKKSNKPGRITPKPRPARVPEREASGPAFGIHPMALPAPANVQTKVDISEPGDRFESEADRVADEVMRMPDGVTRLEANGSRLSVSISRCSGGANLPLQQLSKG